MIPGFVEVSQESVALAEAEVVSAVEAVGGAALASPSPVPYLVPVGVPEPSAWAELAGRLALARRCLVPVAGSDDPVRSAQDAGRSGGSACFRRIGQPTGGGPDPLVLACGRSFKSSGGSIALETPQRRFWLVRSADRSEHLLEEMAAVDRAASGARRMPLLPFRRPVSLPPKLARALANLGHVRRGEPVLDPFLGTGALLAEVGLLGGRLYGIDRDADMVRGAIQNLTFFGLEAEQLVVGDARRSDFRDPTVLFSAVVTDPPYGRSSSTGGEGPGGLVTESLLRWWDRLLPGGRLAVAVPATVPPPGLEVAPRFRIPVRVHRSLTREFCLYEKTV